MKPTSQNTTTAQSFLKFNLANYKTFVTQNSCVEEGFARYRNASLRDFGDKIRHKVQNATNVGFYLHGPVGTGKSHLLHAHYRALPRLTKPSVERNTVNHKEILAFHLHGKRLFIPSTQLLAVIRDTYRKSTGSTEAELIKNYGRVRWLYIDDLGVEKPSEWAIQTLYMVLDARYNNNLPTFISSNLALSDIASRLSQRVASRITEMCADILISGKDRRLEPKTTRKETRK